MLASLETGSPRLLQKPASGAGQETPLLDLGEHWAVFPLEWSRDRRWLIYSVAAPTAWDIWAVDLEGGKRLAMLDTPANEVQGQLSPDGKWLAYASDRSGAWEVYVTAFPDRAGTWQVSPSGGPQPRWSRDGRELVYLDADHWLNSVAVVRAETFTAGAARRLFQIRAVPTVAPFRTSYAISPDGQQFIVTSVVNEAVEPITLVHNWPAALPKP